MPLLQLSLTDYFILLLHTVGYSKDCESRPVFKLKIEAVGDTVLTPGLAAYLSRSLISWLKSLFWN